MYTGTANTECSKQKRCVISNNDVTRKHYKILTDLEIQLEETKCEASFREQCHDCPVGTYGTSGATTCTICGPGKWNEQEGQTDCLSCPVGRYHNTDPNTEDNIYNNVGEHKLVQDWEPAWKWRDEIDEDCKLCVVKTYQDTTGATSCKGCTVGYYQDEEGSISCLKCPEGQYGSAASTCTGCEAGKYVSLITNEWRLLDGDRLYAETAEHLFLQRLYPEWSSTTTTFNNVNQVDNNQFNTNTLDLEMCKKYAGSTFVYSGTDGASIKHNINTYTYSSAYETLPIWTEDSSNVLKDGGTKDPRNHPGIEKPYGCILVGTTVYFNRAQSAVTCGTSGVKCIQQNLDKTNANVCEICEVGSYQLLTGQSYCHSCTTGMYQNEEGQKTNLYAAPYAASGCIQCKFGSYNPYERARYCTICDAGKYLEFGGRSGDACKECPAGRYLVDDSQDPLLIQNSIKTGSVWNDYTTASGLHNNVDKCTLCAAGKYGTTTGQTSETSSCKNCLKGNYQNEAGQTGCKQCPNGKYEINEKSKGCYNCPAGRKGNGAIGATSQDGGCANCPRGRFQNGVGATSCKLCSEGQYQDQNRQTSCKWCAQGRYEHNKGSTGCYDCPSGKGTSGTGRTSSSQCSSCTRTYNYDSSCSACCGSGTYTRYWKAGTWWGPNCNLALSTSHTCTAGSCWTYGTWCGYYGCQDNWDCPGGYYGISNEDWCEGCNFCGGNHNPRDQPGYCFSWGYGYRDQCKHNCKRL